MRSLTFTAVSLLAVNLAATSTAEACGFPVYTPGEYYVFRAWDESRKPESQSSATRNLLEWQQMFDGKPSVDDIREVVYRYTLEQLETICSGIAPDSILHNTFAALLISEPERESAHYLLLAKKCEIWRAKRTSDRWWYPTKADLDYEDLKYIVKSALEYDGTRLRSRYILQAIRAAFTMDDHTLCLDLWYKYIEPSPPSSIRTMCEEYIGGIYFRRGDYEQAILHYANTTHDSSSFWWCVSQLGVESDIDRIKMLYRYCPSSSELAQMVQRICRQAEQYANVTVFGVKGSEDWKSDYNRYLENRDSYMALRDLALQAATEGRGDDAAMWQYTAAFLSLIDGDAALCSEQLATASRMNATPFMKDNIRILAIMAMAMTGGYDAAFERKMLAELQWLDDRIASNIDDAVRGEYLSWERSMYFGYSMYYYNDMMRKIVLGVMVPRYLSMGNEHRSLLLTGMTSERMRSLTDLRKHEKQQDYRWNIDFYTEVFDLMDSLKTESVVRYRNTLANGNGNSFDRFCASRCYNNTDYLDEIIGTKYMREQQFDHAVEYLARVRPDYDTTLNVYEYYSTDPFRDPFTGQKPAVIRKAYKLNFARRMAEMQRIISATNDPGLRCEMQYRYAMSLERATDDCWALLRYGLGRVVKCSHTGWKNTMRTYAVELLNEVYEVSPDPELRALCLTGLMWSYRNEGGYSYEYDNDTGRWRQIRKPQSPYGRYATLLESTFAGTDARKLLREECDTYWSYVTDDNS